MTPPPNDVVLSVRGAAKLAKVGTRTIRRAAKLGHLQGRNIGGSTGWRFTRGAVIAWINSTTRISNADNA